MKIVSLYDFNGGKRAVFERYPQEFSELERAIENIRADDFLTKESEEKTTFGQLFYAPIHLNKEFKRQLAPLGWRSKRVNCEYTCGDFMEGYVPSPTRQPPYREIDFVKADKKLGVEVQFGKYAFMVYDVCAKMPIFRNLGHIDTGVEIVPVKNFSSRMSTGVSYFEQIVWDLEIRRVSDIDVPVLILGIDA